MANSMKAFMRKEPESVEAGFCIACALFVEEREKRGVLVNRPYTKWTKATTFLSGKSNGTDKTGHFNMSSHAKAARTAIEFIESYENPHKNIISYVDSAAAERLKENRHILRMIVDVILYWGRQAIPLRGNKEHSSEATTNPGNFLALLKLFGKYDEIQ